MTTVIQGVLPDSAQSWTIKIGSLSANPIIHIKHYLEDFLN